MIYPFLALAGLVLALLSPSARADSIARYSEGWVRITALPCTDDKIRGMVALSGGDPADYRAATAEFKGQPFQACWTPLFEKAALFVRYEDGEYNVFPFKDFQPQQGV
jgi:hypothetical protein